MNEVNYKELLKKSLVEIKGLKSRIKRQDSDISLNQIAIVGIGCRFPSKINSPQLLWQTFLNGLDAIQEIPSIRWDINNYFDVNPKVPGKMYTRYGGFLDGVDEFDPPFFNISPREAIDIDPQHRLLLETAWE
ncbi:MAG: beta-ketoacyl synthase N-terminal-like domain-containing protein, partial [Candidatus Aquirickettsiella sp.]